MELEIQSGLFARGGVAAEVEGRAWTRAMLEFEAALAGALAEVGAAPPAAAVEIAAVCDEIELDLAALGEGAAADGTPVPALLAALRERLSEDAAAHLHRGATSQDVVDTAAMLVAKRALAPLLADLEAAAEAAAGLADRHRAATQAGRTLLQQALPVTFGLRAAGWLSALDEAAVELASRQRHLALQLGGGAGTLASLEGDGIAAAAALARRLQLAEPVLPWQANRIRPALLAGALGAAAGVAGKIGTDVALLAQTEVAEVAAGRGRGGSSTLPHKRNPVFAVAAVACSKRTPALVATMLAVMPGELDRAAGAWQAEAETLSELLRLTGSAAVAARELLEGLEVDPGRMRANLALTEGLLMSEALTTALSGEIGRPAALDLVADASRRALEESRPLADVAAAVPQIATALGPEGIAEALDPVADLGSAAELVDRALAAHREQVGAG